MKEPTRIKLSQLLRNQSCYSLLQVAVFSLIVLTTRTKGDASECYNCYSTDKGGCMEPYDGRYQYNSNILIPDCNYDMARNFHSSIMYVLTTDTHETIVTRVDESYISKWDRLTSLRSFYCCKAVFQVSIAGHAHRYVVRGCCCSPSSYDQCQETTMILKNLSGTAPKNTTYDLQHCSTCGSARCNTSPTSIVHGVLATIFVLVALIVSALNWLNVTTKLL